MERRAFKITPLFIYLPKNNGMAGACNRQTDNLKTVIEKIELKIVRKRSYKWKTMPQVLSNATLTTKDYFYQLARFQIQSEIPF